MSLPDRNSVDPKDTMAYASVVWAKSNLVICPTCREHGLAGYLGHKLVGFACHKCGPLTQKNPPVESGS